MSGVVKSKRSRRGRGRDRGARRNRGRGRGRGRGGDDDGLGVGDPNTIPVPVYQAYGQQGNHPVSFYANASGGAVYGTIIGAPNGGSNTPGGGGSSTPGGGSTPGVGGVNGVGFGIGGGSGNEESDEADFSASFDLTEFEQGHAIQISAMEFYITSLDNEEKRNSMKALTARIASGEISMERIREYAKAVNPTEPHKFLMKLARQLILAHHHDTLHNLPPGLRPILTCAENRDKLIEIIDNKRLQDADVDAAWIDFAKAASDPPCMYPSRHFEAALRIFCEDNPGLWERSEKRVMRDMGVVFGEGDMLLLDIPDDAPGMVGKGGIGSSAVEMDNMGMDDDLPALGDGVELDLDVIVEEMGKEPVKQTVKQAVKQGVGKQGVGKHGVDGNVNYGGLNGNVGVNGVVNGGNVNPIVPRKVAPSSAYQAFSAPPRAPDHQPNVNMGGYMG